MPVRNLDYIRQKDARLYETLSDIIGSQHNISQQTNSNQTGEPYAPPPVQGLKVSGQNGHFQIAIQDQADQYRGIRYFVEHADNPNFTSPHVIELGASRNGSVFLGNATRYFRAYSAYGSSPPGPAVYHGSPSMPQPVTGGGQVGAPDFLDSEGSGTGKRGQGLSGPGPVPYRSRNGAPPVRGTPSSQPSGNMGSTISGASVGLPQGVIPMLPVSGGGGTGGAAATTIVDVRTLTGNLTISPPSGGLLWALILRQDSVGGHTISWGTGVTGASTYIDTTPSTISTFLFAYDTTTKVWVMVGQPTTGMTP